jgi:hypothetical protein
VSLLRIQREDLSYYFAVCHDERGDRFGPKPAHGFKAVSDVRGPELSLGRHVGQYERLITSKRRCKFCPRNHVQRSVEIAKT